jgi:AcrR family transcriptional regulator
MQKRESQQFDELIGKCLAAFIAAGSLDLSLDRLADSVGVSKRMLIHYFGSREELEERAVAALEDQLRSQFNPDRFTVGVPCHAVVEALWDQSTSPESRGVLLLIMDVSRRAWSGSARAKAFYAEQQKLWVEMLGRFLPSAAAAEEFLQLFQGAILAYLVTGDRELGRRSLLRLARGEVAPSSKPSRE